MAMRGSDLECSSSSFSANDSERGESSLEEEEVLCKTTPLGILPYQFEPTASDDPSSDSSSDDETQSQTDAENLAGIDPDNRTGTTNW